MFHRSFSAPYPFARSRRRALGLLVALASLPSFAAEPAAVRIAPDVYVVQGAAALGSSANRNFISNAGFVITGDSVVVIDALGSPAVALSLIGEIRKLTPLPISHVIVTHYHADHIYGLQAFKAVGARVLAHPAAREYLNSDGARQRLEYSRSEMAPWIDADTRLVHADEWIDRPTTLKLGAVEIDLLPAGPAHTPEDLAVVVRGRGVVFTGDLAFLGRVPFVGQADSRQWIASIDRLIALQPKLLVPGHGPIAESPLEALRFTRDYLAYLRETMGRAARELEPFEEAYRTTDWSRYSRVPMFEATHRMNAYNTYLLMEQER